MKSSLTRLNKRAKTKTVNWNNNRVYSLLTKQKEEKEKEKKMFADLHSSA